MAMTDSGTYIGRVGALAVALGIGAAIAHGAAFAYADGSDTAGASGGNSAQGSSPDSGSRHDAGHRENDDKSPVPTANPAHAKAQTDDTTSPGSSASIRRTLSKDATADDERSQSAPQSTPATSVKTATPDAGSAAPVEVKYPKTVVVQSLHVSSNESAKAGSADQAPAPPVTPGQATTLTGVADAARRELESRSQTTAATVTTASTIADAPATSSDPKPSSVTTTVSPLGTPDQIDAEKIATQIVSSPLVQIAKQILKVAWIASGYQQFAAVGGPDAGNFAQLDEAVNEYALQAAFELQLLNPNDPKVIQQVMPPHTWYGESFGGARILYDNPDTIYRMIPVNNSSSYVISGSFGGGMPADTTFSVLTGLTGTTTAVLSGRDLVVNPNGSFTISVDARATDPDNPNHLQLPSGATLVAARNTLSDWNTQEPMSLSVQRVGGPPNNLFSQLGLYDIPVIGPALTGNPLTSALMSLVPPLAHPPVALQAAETAIIMCLGLIMEPQYMAVATRVADTGQLKSPNTLSDPAHNASFLATQLQSAGYFQLSDQQALVITINPGNANYFSVPVTNVWTITNDYWDQPTSLNSLQAVQNGDGTYTLVVAPTDPGVQNWVSTGGLNLGTLSIRFQDLQDTPGLSSPTVAARVVDIDELLNEFPVLVAQPADAAFREEQRETRRAGYALRYAPYPLTT